MEVVEAFLSICNGSRGLFNFHSRRRHSSNGNRGSFNDYPRRSSCNGNRGLFNNQPRRSSCIGNRGLFNDQPCRSSCIGNRGSFNYQLRRSSCIGNRGSFNYYPQYLSRPALHDTEEIFPVSYEKNKEKLKLQEALYYSPMSGTEAKNGVIQVGDTPLGTLKRNQKGTDESSQVYCGICMDGKPGEEMFRNQNCLHSFCNDCIGMYVATKIRENISIIKCPDPICREILDSQYCRSIIPKEVFDRWQNTLCENLVPGSQKFYCPFKDCSAMLIYDAEEVVTSSECPHCNRLFCAQCKAPWHAGIDCREFQSMQQHERAREDLMLMELAKNKRWKRCPECNFFVEKTGGCSEITCRCGHIFCYACGSSCINGHHECIPQ